MNLPFTKKQKPRINKKQMAAGVGAAAGIGLLAYGVKKFLSARKQNQASSDATSFDARSKSGESARGFTKPKNRVDRESFNSFPASDAPSHMPGVS